MVVMNEVLEKKFAEKMVQNIERIGIKIDIDLYGFKPYEPIKVPVYKVDSDYYLLLKDFDICDSVEYNYDNLMNQDINDITSIYCYEFISDNRIGKDLQIIKLEVFIKQEGRNGVLGYVK